MNKNIVLTNGDLKKLQKVELEMLEEFDRICKKHKIDYTLSGGTLLGAVRHDGFIPWDDDIDINMTRKNYNKFIKVQKEELNSKKFYLDCIETNYDCGMLYAKLKRKNSLCVESLSNRNEEEQNIWIDIFPVDNISNNRIMQKYCYLKVYCLKIILMYKYNYIKDHDNKILFNLIKFTSIFFNKEKLKSKLSKTVTKYNNINTDYFVEYSSPYLGKQIMPNEVYSSYKYHEFEGKNFKIIKNYDIYLTTLYGNFMQLPPKEDRYPHHFIKKLKFPK